MKNKSKMLLTVALITNIVILKPKDLMMSVKTRGTTEIKPLKSNICLMGAIPRFPIDLAKRFSIINAFIIDLEFSAKFSYIITPVARAFWAGHNNFPVLIK